MIDEKYYWRIVENEIFYCKKVGEKVSDQLYILEENGKFGIANENLHFLCSPVFDEIFLAFPNYFWAKMNGNWNLINKNGEVIFSKCFKEVSIFEKGFACVSYDGKNYGFINKKGDFILPPKFGEGKYLGSGFFAVSKIVKETTSPNKYYNLNGELFQYGIIDKNENLVYPFSLNRIPQLSKIRKELLDKK